MEINGVAHTFITAGDFERSRAFYRQLLPFMGLKCVMDSDSVYYCVGGRTGFAVQKPAPEYEGERFVQNRVGLHHICFRVRSREDVREAYDFLVGQDCTIIRSPEDGGWAPGYHSILFEDPDGVRLEINFVPGKGLFATPEQKVMAPLG